MVVGMGRRKRAVTQQGYATSPQERYRAWKQKRADVGCVFARHMATKPKAFGQRAEVVTGSDAAALANEIATRVTAFVRDPKIVAAALIFPDVTRLRTLVNVALALKSHPHWGVRRRTIRGTPIGDVVAFNVVRDIPMRSGVCPSEALVLGPFPAFPNTRRAPVTALEIFVGVPPKRQRDGKPTKKAHLADVPIELPTAKAFDTTWENSKRARLRSLGGIDDKRAKAKVAFVVPMKLAKTLGCAP